MADADGIDALMKRHPSLYKMHQDVCNLGMAHGQALAAEEKAREAYLAASRAFSARRAEIEQMEARMHRGLSDHELRVHEIFACTAEPET
jgi:hypothetical protein